MYTYVHTEITHTKRMWLTKLWPLVLWWIRGHGGMRINEPEPQKFTQGKQRVNNNHVFLVYDV